MKFCSCQFMLYARVTPTSISYFCRNCGADEEVTSDVVSTRVISKPNEATLSISRYTKFNPTLPRVTMDCARSGCTNRSIIVVRYDDVQLKYAYLCPSCDETWKT